MTEQARKKKLCSEDLYHEMYHSTNCMYTQSSNAQFCLQAEYWYCIVFRDNTVQQEALTSTSMLCGMSMCACETFFRIRGLLCMWSPKNRQQNRIYGKKNPNIYKTTKMKTNRCICMRLYDLIHESRIQSVRKNWNFFFIAAGEAKSTRKKSKWTVSLFPCNSQFNGEFANFEWYV